MGPLTRLTEIVEQAWAERAGPRPLDAEVEARWRAGRDAWPSVRLDVTSFVSHLAAVASPDLPPLAHAADLFLACACMRGDPAALACFDAAHRAAMRQSIARVNASNVFCDEILQRVRHKLFVARGDHPPAIREYAGRAPLGGWLRVVAKREALDTVRAQRRRDAHQSAATDGALGAALAPELVYIKATYRAQFEDATRDAFAALSARQRALLRLHLAERMTLGQLGAMYGVSHSTIARWLTEAREGLVKAARDCLRDRFSMSASEIDSVAAVVRSELDVGVLDLLRSTRG